LDQAGIKTVLGLVKYIDWANFSPESTSSNTSALAEIINKLRNANLEALSAKTLNDCLHILRVDTAAIIGGLKPVSDYNREAYKAEVREKITAGMNASEANSAGIKKMFPKQMPGRPFYVELIDELIKEDYSQESEAEREKVLKKLEIPGEAPKAKAGPKNFRPLLIEALNALGSSGSALADIAAKQTENNNVLQNRKRSLGEKISALIGQMFNKEPPPVIYDVQYVDPVRGLPVKEKVNWTLFIVELEKKTKILGALCAKGSAAAKLETMQEKQVLELLEKNIRDVTTFHKTLTGLDEFFKIAAPQNDKAKIKGVKPELSTIKSALGKVTAKKTEYLASIEEEEQLKKLGITE
jgi:hypothetical protein